ncbi:MAG: hypothetical protein ABH952_07620 [Candidatus Omnitrophota bacterium]
MIKIVFLPMIIVLGLFIFTPAYLLAEDTEGLDDLNDPFFSFEEPQVSLKEIKKPPEADNSPRELNLALEAIFYNQTLPMAVINGRVITEGSMVNYNKKVLKITPQRIDLSDGLKDYYINLRNVTTDYRP